MPSIPSPAASTSTRPSPSPFPPVVTPPAHPASVPTQLVVDLTTLLTISDFPSFYPGTPSDSFHPIYYALPDGSLVASPFHNDLTTNNVCLIITGFLLSVFLRNVCKATTYLWRGRIKKKALLYTLFLSQLLGPIAIIPLIVTQFSTYTNCNVYVSRYFPTLHTQTIRQHSAHIFHRQWHLSLFIGSSTSPPKKR